MAMISSIMKDKTKNYESQYRLGKIKNKIQDAISLNKSGRTKMNMKIVKLKATPRLCKSVHRKSAK